MNTRRNACVRLANRLPGRSLRFCRFKRRCCAHKPFLTNVNCAHFVSAFLQPMKEALWRVDTRASQDGSCQIKKESTGITWPAYLWYLTACLPLIGWD